MYNDLLSHDGKGADQLPLARHSLSFAPFSTYPSLQVWLTREPNVSDVTSVIPFEGVPGPPQPTVCEKQFVANLLNKNILCVRKVQGQSEAVVF